MSSIHEPLTGVISTLHPVGINVNDTNNDSKKVDRQRQPEGLDCNIAVAPASSTSADVPSLPFNLTLHSQKSFEEPFHGLPIEIRLMIWEYIIMPAIKVIEQSPHQARDLSERALGLGPMIQSSIPEPRLRFKPNLSTLTSLQATSRGVRAEVSELLQRHGVIIAVESVQPYSIKAVLRRFSRSHAPRIASLRMRAHGYKLSRPGILGFDCAFEIFREQTYLPPRLSRLDYIVDTKLLWTKAMECATDRGQVWEVSNDKDRRSWLRGALVDAGFSFTHAHRLVLSGSLDEVRVVFQYDHSDEVKFLGEGWEQLVDVLGPAYGSKAKISKYKVPDPYVAGADIWAITFTRDGDSGSKQHGGKHRGG